MIIRENQTWLQLIFTLRKGTILEEIWMRVVAVTLFAVLVTVLFLHGDLDRSLTATPFSIVGFAVSIFLGFRNAAAYDRFWEGRKLWGALVNTARTLARQTETLLHSDDDAVGATLKDETRTFARVLMGYVHALRVHLRQDGEWTAMTRFLDEKTGAMVMSHDNKPAALLLAMSATLRRWRNLGALDGFTHIEMERHVVELCNIQGGCERIRATPIPLSHTTLTHRMIAVYLWMLPLGLIETVGMFTPVVTLLVAFAFFGLDQLGEEMENPFGVDCNDLPLNFLATMIERNIRQTVDDNDDIPALPLPNTADVLL